MDALIHRVVDGDTSAWHALWSAIEPTIWHVTGQWRLVGPLSRSDDDRRNILVEVMHLLREGEHRRLRIYLQSAGNRPTSSFKTWLATVTARAAIDYLRAHPEFDDARGRASEEPRWVRLLPMAEIELGTIESDAATRASAAQLVERARRDLKPDQLRALSLWLEGSSHDDIRMELGLAHSIEAERLVRAALKRLRDRFASPHDLDAEPLETRT